MNSHLDQITVDLPGLDPDVVFAVLTDIDRLPEWNALIVSVIERPAALVPGAIWRVQLEDGPMRWASRSVLVEHDASERRFVHRSGTDDDNPSFTEWTWIARPTPTGTALTVRWHLSPITHLRRWVIAPARSIKLRREVPRSVERLAERCRATADHPAS